MASLVAASCGDCRYTPEGHVRKAPAGNVAPPLTWTSATSRPGGLPSTVEFWEPDVECECDETDRCDPESCAARFGVPGGKKALDEDVETTRWCTCWRTLGIGWVAGESVKTGFGEVADSPLASGDAAASWMSALHTIEAAGLGLGLPKPSRELDLVGVFGEPGDGDAACDATVTAVTAAL